MKWLELHQQSEAQAAAADDALRAANKAEAKQRYASAAEFETLALAEVGPDKTRTRGILAVSVGALWLRAEKFDAALEHSTRWAVAREIPDFAVRELQEIRRDAEHALATPSVELDVRQELVVETHLSRQETEGAQSVGQDRPEPASSDILSALDITPLVTKSLLSKYKTNEVDRTFLDACLEARADVDHVTPRYEISLLHCLQDLSRDTLAESKVPQTELTRLLYSVLVGLGSDAPKIGGASYCRSVIDWHRSHKSKLWSEHSSLWESHRSDLISRCDGGVSLAFRCNEALADDGRVFRGADRDAWTLALLRVLGTICAGTTDAGMTAAYRANRNLAAHVWKNLTKVYDGIDDRCTEVLIRLGKHHSRGDSNTRSPRTAFAKALRVSVTHRDRLEERAPHLLLGTIERKDGDTLVLAAQLRREIRERTWDRLEVALVPCVASLVAEELGENVWVQQARLWAELADDIARLYAPGWDAESFFARSILRLRYRLRSVCCDWASPSPFKRAVLARVAVLEMLHEILAALEHQRSREWTWRGTSPLGELDRIVNVLDAKRAAVELGLMLEVLAVRGESIAEFAGVRTADLKSSLALVEMPLPVLWRLVAAADAAKARMLERWNHGSVPARVLAELAFLEQRHAALSALEDQPDS